MVSHNLIKIVTLFHWVKGSMHQCRFSIFYYSLLKNLPSFLPSPPSFFFVLNQWKKQSYQFYPSQTLLIIFYPFFVCPLDRISVRWKKQWKQLDQTQMRVVPLWSSKSGSFWRTDTPNGIRTGSRTGVSSFAFTSLCLSVPKLFKFQSSSFFFLFLCSRSD